MRYYYKKILSSKNTNFLTLSLIIWMTIILIGDYAVLQSIKNGLEILDPGGDALVITNPGSGSFNSHLKLILTSNTIWHGLSRLFNRFLADRDRLPVNPFLSFSHLLLSASRSKHKSHKPRNENPRNKNPGNKKHPSGPSPKFKSRDGNPRVSFS